MSAVDRFTDQHLTCRAYGHRWSNTSVVRVVNARNQPIEYRAGLACDRCTTTRTQVLDGSGYVLRNTYSYAEGYSKTPDEERVHKHDARLGWLGRLSTIETQKEET